MFKRLPLCPYISAVTKIVPHNYMNDFLCGLLQRLSVLYCNDLIKDVSLITCCHEGKGPSINALL